MKVGEVDYIAVADPVDDIADRAAQHEGEGDRVVAPLFAPQPEGDAGRDGGGERHQQPAAGVGAGGEEAHRHAVILDTEHIESLEQLNDPTMLEVVRIVYDIQKGKAAWTERMCRRVNITRT